MRLAGGYLTLATVRGAAVRLHWTVPLGALGFGRLELRPGAWLGFLLLVLVHELGHAALVWRYRLQVTAIDVHAIGGACRYTGRVSDRRRAVIAWGGVMAQAAVALVTVPLWWAGPPLGPFATDLVGTLIAVNLIVAVVNLLPIAPLDGALAWRALRRRKPLPTSVTAALPPGVRFETPDEPAPRSGGVRLGVHRIDLGAPGPVPVELPGASPPRPTRTPASSPAPPSSRSVADELAAIEAIDRAEPVDSPEVRKILDALVPGPRRRS